MAVPWLRLIDAALGMTDLARRVTRKPDDQLAAAAPGGPLEARLAGVVVAALKEAFDRDTRRLELEREQLAAERARTERALRLELVRQAGDREIGRLRLIAGVAIVSWLGTLFFSARLVDGSVAARVALGAGWLLLLGALGAAFSAQAQIGRSLTGASVAGLERGAPDPRDVTIDLGAAGAAAPWLVVAGLAAIALGVLVA
jgi:hypothetical protein